MGRNGVLDRENAVIARRLARWQKYACGRRRLEAVALVLEGATVEEAAKRVGAGSGERVWDWVLQADRDGVQSLAAGGQGPRIKVDVSAVELRMMARVEKDRRVAMRLCAVANVLVGMTAGEAAVRASVSQGTVQEWVRLCRRGGVAGLRPRRRAGPDGKLSNRGLERVRDVILKGPEAAPGCLAAWTVAELREAVRRVSGERYSRSGVRYLLRRLGMSWAGRRGRPTERPELGVRIVGDVARRLPEGIA